MSPIPVGAVEVAAMSLKDGAAALAIETRGFLREIAEKLSQSVLENVDGVQKPLGNGVFDAESWRTGLRDGVESIEPLEQRVDFLRSQFCLNPEFKMKHLIHINTAITHLKGIDGFDGVLRLLASDMQTPAFKGAWSEMISGTRFQEYALREGRPEKQVAAFRKIVDVPGVGKTDLDLVLRDGTVIENKWQQNLTGDVARTKIDKLAAAVDGQILVPGTDIQVSRAVTINRGHITGPIAEYAASKGVLVLPHDSYVKAVAKLNN